MKKYPCPCCGNIVHDQPPGSYSICPVCTWEDDIIQLRWPDYSGGANGPSLIAAQSSFFGSSFPRACEMVEAGESSPWHRTRGFVVPTPLLTISNLADAGDAETATPAGDVLSRGAGDQL